MEGSKHDSVPTLWMADKSLCRYVYDITTEFHSCVIALYEVLSFGLHPHVERQQNVSIDVLMIEVSILHHFHSVNINNDL